MTPEIRRVLSASVLSAVLLLPAYPVPDACAGQFGASATVGYTRLAEEFGSAESESIIPGLRYQEEVWDVNVSLPILIQKQNTVNRVGGMMVPAAGSTSSSGTTGGPMGGRSGTTSSSTSSTQAELGDFYVNGEYRVRSEGDVLPGFWATAQLKAPTAASGFGTGEWDYGAGLSLRKTIDPIALFGDVGYLVTGDSATQSYKNPVTFGLGGGPVLGANREWGLLLYYQAASPVVEGLPGQSQLSFGANYRASQTVYVSLLLGKGFTTSTPDLSASGGATVYF